MTGQQLSDNTTELAELELRLRTDLDFSMQEHGGTQYYIVEDRTNSRFYQIGIAEYTFISLLDGRTSLTVALRLTAARLGPNAFSEQGAVAIVKWLVDCQLVTTAASTDAQRLVESASKAENRSRVSRLNPLLLKISLLNPERLLDALSPWLGWLTSGSAVASWLTLCAAAIYQLLANSDRLGASANLALDRSNWLWLTITWLVLKFCHELGHAMTCRRFGGHVRDAGVMLILFAPIPYVDVTSSWRFASKWQRIATSGAGMLVELGLAAVAVLVWSTSDDHLLRHHAYNVMLLGSVTTLAFNANFLMRFDGYYMLADWLEIPNLYSLGQQYLSYVGRRYILGVKLDPPRWRSQLIINLYGFASLAWRVFVCACLVIAAEALLFGFGIVLSLAAVLLWLGTPTLRFASYLFDARSTERPKLQRLAMVCACGACLLIAAFTVIPWPGRVSAPAIVQYAPLTRVHTRAPGFVERFHVQPGDLVDKGQLLAELSNPELEMELMDLQLSIQKSQVRRRSYHLNERLAAYQAEASALEALQKRAVQLRAQLAALQIRAPESGRVIARDLDALLDRFLPRGTELAAIADEHRKELVLSIHQDNIARFRSAVGSPVTWCMTPGIGGRCRLSAVEPGASDEVTQAALAATSLGPIPVREVTTNLGSTALRYLNPRFEGKIALSTSESVQLSSGQRGMVKLSAHNGKFGGHVYRTIRSWFRQQISRSGVAST